MGRPMVPNNLSGGDPRYTTHLVASHRSGEKENCLKAGKLCTLPSRKSHLAVRNGVVLLKHLVCHMDYSCPVWRSAARTHFRRLHVLKFMFFALLLMTLVGYQADTRGSRCSALCRPNHGPDSSSDSKVADVGNPEYGNLAHTLTDDSPRPLTRKPRAARASRGHRCDGQFN